MSLTRVSRPLGRGGGGLRENLGMEQTIVRTREVTKVYQMGKVEVHALRGIDLEIEGGE